MRVHRTDAGEFRGHERTPQGGLRIAAALARTGVLTYRDADGREWREYRPPTEVFSDLSLSTLRGAPLTDDHPADLVTAGNWRTLARGHVADDVRQEGDKIVATVLAQDADVVRRIESGELVELSCGYTCEIDPTPGTSPEGEPYDAVQRGHSHNHLAVGPEGWGRSGPSVALRLNGAAVQVRPPPGVTTAQTAQSAQTIPRADARQEKTSMKKTIKVGKRELKLDADTPEDEMKVAQDEVSALEEKANASPAAAEKLAAANATVQTLAAQLSELTALCAEEMGMAPAEGAAAPTPEAVMNSVKAKRAKLAAEALHADARTVLGTSVKLDGKSVAEIKRAVVAHAHPAVKLDALSADTVEGMYLATVASARKTAAQPARNEALAAARAVVETHQDSNDEDPAARMAQAREAQRERAMKGGR